VCSAGCEGEKGDCARERGVTGSHGIVLIEGSQETWSCKVDMLRNRLA
jgi:hypothetical protein